MICNPKNRIRRHLVHGPEWIVGDSATSGGYREDDEKVYLIHLTPPRFVMSWADETGEIAGTLRWLDEEPPRDVAADLVLRATQVFQACCDDQK